jgi:hypothetical protein
MEEKNESKIVYSVGFFLLTFWIIFMLYNWEAFKNFKHTDPLWIINISYPYLYILIIIIAATIGICFWFDIGGKTSNIFLLIIFCLILTGTPYFVGSVVRFPDTLGVTDSINTLSDFINPFSISYANSYPLVYVLGDVIHNVTHLDLLTYSNIILSPELIVLIIILWYIFLNRIIQKKSAIYSAALAVPLLIIEISITPYSIGLILILTALFLFLIPSISAKISLVIVLIALTISHPFGIILLSVIMICSFLLKYSFNKVLKNKLKSVISISMILITIVLWFSWTIFQSSMGTGIISSIANVFSIESTYTQQFTPYTIGGGGLVYPWIQQLNMLRYIIYSLLIIIAICFELYIYLIKYKINIIKNIIYKFGYERIFLLIMALSFLSITLFFMLFVRNGEQLTSRSLNLMALAASAYLGTSIYLFRLWIINKQIKFKIVFPIIIIFLLILVSIIIPLHSYSRESYISYSESFCAGKNYYEEVIQTSSHDSVKLYTESNYYYNYMRGQNNLDNYLENKETTIVSIDYDSVYSNKYYVICIK